MLDIKWIRENPEALDRALANRGQEPASAKLIALDEARRATIVLVQEWQERRNRLSKEVGLAKAAKDEARVAELMDQVTRLKSDITNAGEDVEARQTRELEDALAVIPNVPQPDVPVGPDEHANKLHSRWGEPPNVRQAWGNEFKPKEHYELGEQLGQMDFETAAKLSGSRFVVLKKQLARLERALGQFMLDLHTEEHGYTEVQPPLLVRDATLFGTGQLPKMEEDIFFTSFFLERDVRRHASAVRDFFSDESLHNLTQESGNEGLRTAFMKYLDAQAPERRADAVGEAFVDFIRIQMAADQRRATRLGLIPTSEVPLTNLVRESILAEDELPLRFTALTPCFRSEAGASGKDTRGMLRQHQFDKVELVSITTPEQSRDEHERMLACAEEVLRRLDLHYRVMVLSTGDMGFAAQKTYDIEVWLPGQGAYREISSCSVCGDFQARRMQARYRPKAESGGKPPSPRLVHTLNGSGVAVGRALIAVMENYQNPDGSITVPDALRPYMRGVERIEA